MSYRVILRGILLAATVILLLVVAAGALGGAVRQIPQSQTFGQRVETVIQLAAGVLTLLVLLTAVRGRRWAAPVRLAWTVCVVAAAGLSSLVWGPPMLLVTAGFLGAALAGSWLILRALNIGLGWGPPPGSPGMVDKL